MKIGFIARGLTNGGVKRYVENFLETFNTFFYAENSLVLLTDQPDFKEKYKNIQVVYLKKISNLVRFLFGIFYAVKTGEGKKIYPDGEVVGKVHIGRGEV